MTRFKLLFFKKAPQTTITMLQFLCVEVVCLQATANSVSNKSWYVLYFVQDTIRFHQYTLLEFFM